MHIKEKIEKWIKETLETNEVVLVHPKEMEKGDFALILPPLNVRGGGGVIEKLIENKLPEIERIGLANERFVNIFLSKNFFAETIKEINNEAENFGKTDLLGGQKIIIEHTQPNPFKEFHIGHLMNNAIGESVARILKANKADVKTCSYHGDVGLHVAKAVRGLEIYLKQQSWWDIFKQKTEQAEGTSIVSFTKGKITHDRLGEAYTLGSKLFEENKSESESILELNKKIYFKNDKIVNAIYISGRWESLEYFEDIYKKLDSHFDGHFFESESGEIGKGIVKENIGKFFEESEGAVVFRGENFEPKTHTRVFLNKDGLPTYEAKEIGLAKMKMGEFGDYDQSITLTANEQDSFFDVVEVAIGKIFPKLNGRLKHLSHGMLKLPSGKMSSRTGDVITAESLIDQVKEKVLEKIKEREFSDEQKNEIAEIVAIGAIKYSILRQAIGGDIVFDFEKSISFEGDSGPYLQYTAVRAKSVLEKANLTPSPSPRLGEGGEEMLRDWKTTEVEKLLYRFPEAVERAGKEYAPHHLVTYLTELASTFNSFYGNEKIIDENDPVGSAYKLALTSATAHTLKNGLRLLGIKVPERM